MMTCIVCFLRKLFSKKENLPEKTDQAVFNEWKDHIESYFLKYESDLSFTSDNLFTMAAPLPNKKIKEWYRYYSKRLRNAKKIREMTALEEKANQVRINGYKLMYIRGK